MSEEPTAEEVRVLARVLLEKLSKEGKIIAGGWSGYRLIMSPRASQVQIDETRMAFYAGAHHLFTSIINVLGPGQEPTQEDLEKITRIYMELEEWLDQYKKKHGLTGRY